MEPSAETLAEKLHRLGAVIAKAVEATVPVSDVQRLGEVVARAAQWNREV